MAATAAPYGLKPVNEIGGLPYAGSTRQIAIASGTTPNLFYGQVVAIDTNGVIALVTNVGSAADQFPAGTIGVFVGCSYINPTNSQLTFSQYWPTGLTASGATAYVVDDPNTVFQAQSAGSLGQTALGMNINFAAAQGNSYGSTTTGNSTSALSATPVATTGVAFRIVDFVDSTTSTVGDAKTDVLIKFNPVAHSYLNPLGVA